MQHQTPAHRIQRFLEQCHNIRVVSQCSGLSVFAQLLYNELNGTSCGLTDFPVLIHFYITFLLWYFLTGIFNVLCFCNTWYKICIKRLKAMQRRARN